MFYLSGFRSRFAFCRCCFTVFQRCHLFRQFLIFCFQCGDLVIHRCQLCHDVICIDLLTGASLADANRQTYIESGLLIAVKSRCAAYGHHQIFIEVIESAESQCLRAVIVAHCGRQLEFGTRSIIIERMETGQGCGNRTDIINFSAEIRYTAVQRADGAGIALDTLLKYRIRLDTILTFLCDSLRIGLSLRFHGGKTVGICRDICRILCNASAYIDAVHGQPAVDHSSAIHCKSAIDIGTLSNCKRAIRCNIASGTIDLIAFTINCHTVFIQSNRRIGSIIHAHIIITYLELRFPVLCIYIPIVRHGEFPISHTERITIYFRGIDILNAQFIHNRFVGIQLSLYCYRTCTDFVRLHFINKTQFRINMTAGHTNSANVIQTFASRCNRICSNLICQDILRINRSIINACAFSHS